MFPAFGLDRLLPQQRRATRERVEKLVVQIVAVGQRNDGGVLHGRMLNYFSGIENHRETLAASLRVPDHPGATVARLMRGLDGFGYRFVDRMKLVITRDLL